MDTGAYLGKKGWILGHILGEIMDLEFENHKNGGRSALNITDPCSVIFSKQVSICHIPTRLGISSRKAGDFVIVEFPPLHLFFGKGNRHPATHKK